MSTVVSEFPDYLIRNCNVSAAGHVSGGGTQSGPGPHHGIFNADRSIHTGHHPNWSNGMDPDDKKRVNDERDRLGLGRKKKPNSNFKLNQGRYSHQSANKHNQLTQLKAASAK